MRYATVHHLSPYIVKLKVSSLEATDADIDEYLRVFDTFFERKGMVVMVDISDAKFLKSEHRIRMGNWNKTNDSRIKAHWAGMCTINTNVVALMMLKGIFLISPPPVAYTVVSNEAAAVDWAHKAIAKFESKLSPQNA